MVTILRHELDWLTDDALRSRKRRLRKNNWTKEEEETAGKREGIEKDGKKGRGGSSKGGMVQAGI